jgi:hypothetical protein
MPRYEYMAVTVRTSHDTSAADATAADGEVAPPSKPDRGKKRVASEVNAIDDGQARDGMTKGDRHERGVPARLGVLEGASSVVLRAACAPHPHRSGCLRRKFSLPLAAGTPIPLDALWSAARVSGAALAAR